MYIKYNPNTMTHKNRKIKIILVNILTDIGDVIKRLKEDYDIPVNEIVLIDDRYVEGAIIKSPLVAKCVEKGMIIKNTTEYNRMVKNPVFVDNDVLNRYPIVANINRISEENLNNIVSMHSNAPNIFVVLDSMINSMEHGNYQHDYTFRYTIEMSRGIYYPSIDKDIMYLINKLRIKKNKVLSTESLIVQYRNINFTKSKYITAPSLDSDCITVVPSVHYNTTTSTMLNNAGRFELDIVPGDRLQLLSPRVLTQGCKEFVVPIGSCLEVIGITGKNTSVFPCIYTVKCIIKTPESHTYGAVDLGEVEVPINASYYAMFFDSSFFNTNGEHLFDMPANAKETIHTSRALDVAPYQVLAPWMTKYRFSEHTTVYIQDEVGSINIMSEETYFNNLACVSSKLDIISSFRFEPGIA